MSGARLVPVAAAAWSAAALVTLTPALAGGVAMVAWLCVGAFLLAMRGRGRGTWQRHAGMAVVGLALVAAATVSSHVALAQPQRENVLELSVSGGRAVTLEVIVVGKVERRTDGSAAFDALATRVDVGENSKAVWAEVTVRLDPEWLPGASDIDAGAVVVVHGTARHADPGDRAVLNVRASQGAEVLNPPTGIFAATAHLRRTLVASARELPGSGAELIPGLAVGDTALVGADLDADMKASSLSHLTAVSGANCALVVGIAFAVTAALGGGRVLRVMAGASTLVGFILLVTPEPSVVRAGMMASIALLALLCGRPGAGLATLALAVTVLLMLDPWLATSLGFALSAAATGALLVLARPLASGLGRWMPRPLALTIAVPLSAQLACGPLLVLIEPSVPVYGVVANILAAPAAPVATVLGLAACLTPWAPWLRDGLVALTWLPASWIAGTAHTAAGLPGGTLGWVEGWGGAALLCVVGGVIVLAVTVHGDRGRARAARSLAHATLAILVGVMVGTASLGSVAGAWTVPRDWQLLMCDVGQGDAILMRSADEVALIDTGPTDVALDACLTRAGVTRIDVLVLTHFDLDHVGGADAVVGRVDTVIHGPANPEGEDTLQRLRNAGAETVAVQAGASGALGDGTWRILWPRASAATRAGNDASVVVEVTTPDLGDVLLLGDLSESPQCAIRATGALLPRYAIVKVAHHGSADQCVELYEATRPALALIPVGTENTYGHPRQEILDVLDAIGARTVRSDESGVVAVSAHEGELRLWREHP
ncbi:ComEC/Rec2 family competence protein [Microbacterium sp. C7(2022)]|uniref:ComEC/Rec2 family competence protein n=1 Tax=Microbacterium sp. C7(2022) TaxID=2992759 RepID=UPI00237AADBB|nr:ComEC/Rec2 family competence protein [Microbacterium sp. C7(2022)]